MTPSDPQESDALFSASELEAKGWRRRFVADEPRLSESVETYEELGFEVRLARVSFDDEACSECMRRDPDRFRLIYTKKRDDGEESRSEEQ